MTRPRWLMTLMCGAALVLGACGDGAAPTTPLFPAAPLANVSTCSAGSYDAGGGCVPADPGYYVAVDYATSQTPCAAGTYQPSAGATSCIFASSGHYVPGAGATKQTACSQGTYQPRTGQVGCIDAPPGSFASGTGQAAPADCFVGTYQPLSRQASCLPADAGYYVPTRKATSQTPCALGSYQPSTRQASCLLAGIGFYVDVIAADAPIACPAGTTTLAPGATDVSQCIRPFDWQGFESPIDASAVNVAKAGSAVAVKFSLNRDEGLAIFQAGSPSSAEIACTNGAVSSTSMETETAGNSVLTYDATSDTYKYVWKTEKGWSGSCRRLTLKFTDGSVRTADFQFSR